MITRISSLLAFAVFPLCGLRAEPTALIYSVVAPAAEASEDGTVHFQLAVLNPSPVSATFSLPATFTAQLVGASEHWEIPVVSTSVAGRSIEPGAFALVPLSVRLPSGAAGRLVLELDQPAPLRVAISVAAQASPPAATPMAVTRAPASLIERRTAVAHLKNYFPGAFAPHDPIYFIYGPRVPAAKFQFSFKYRLPMDDGWLARKLPEMRGLHVAFTQRSLWDITASSSPFYDTSYMPEFLYQFAASDRRLPGGFQWLGWSAALKHESNGQGGDRSRSMNCAYARTAISWGNLDRWHLIVAPRIFEYVGDRFDNPNIADYRGWGDIQVMIGRNDGPALLLYGREGRGFRHGAFQADFTIPTSMLSGSFATYLLFQYWAGYGESLLHYDRHTETVRAGFSLVR